ncbi:MAG: hypothetical protein KJ676_05885 [Alphaproteobacteria bacterium]|nr:hypothetical protein [Alphaproteobacteria bacterium]MBU1526992.1 hypothetical protein [Alphaproteobacteria bacterium]MBU2351989.1 hypothetical protein [Alphaproteobacteria bacterium]MBU2381580.1 hypothetical protein [Alphaproteobacteria bacterium]
MAVLTGCDRPSVREPAQAIVAQDIPSYLQAKAEWLFRDVPGVTVVDLRVSRDRTIACGLLLAPGQEPALFVSADTTPETLERSFGPPFLGADTPREHELEARRSAQVAEICRRNGLMPDARGRLVEKGGQG